jgi:hypothetical protein
MDTETKRDITLKLKLSETALVSGDMEAAQYWLDAAKKSQDEYRRFQTEG